MIPAAAPVTDNDRFRAAARMYLVYALVYEIGGVYLVSQGIGVPSAAGARGRLAYTLFWAIIGLVPLLGVPYLLRRPRAWFERWLLSRRDFARILAVFMAYRAFNVAHVALRGETAVVAAPWGGALTFRAGALVFLAVTVVALVFVARAGWRAEARA
jgi:hypothetical protein